MKKGLIWLIGLEIGIISISLLNVILILLNKNQMTYDLYILGIALFVLVIIFAIIRNKRKRNQIHKK